MHAVKRRRNWHRHDYSEINDGKKVSFYEQAFYTACQQDSYSMAFHLGVFFKAIQSGTVMFVKNLKKKKFLE